MVRTPSIISSSQLGGDSFGYHWIDDDTFSLYLLDVCGHGVGAALLSISVMNVLRTSSLVDTNFRDPANVLGNLNAAFPMEQHNDMYFTAWYGVYTLSTNNLSFACGGHPPAVLIAQDGTVRHLSAKGAVVGAFPKPTYETASTTVVPGSRLYLFSDGTYEIDRPDSSMMTHEEFSLILKDPVKSGVSKLQAIVTEVRRQQEQEAFVDDFSLVEFCFPDEQLPSHGVLKLKATLGEVARLHPFLTSYCEHEGTPMEQVFDFEVILEELVTNVIKYGGVDAGQEAASSNSCAKGTKSQSASATGAIRSTHLPGTKSILINRSKNARSEASASTLSRNSPTPRAMSTRMERTS